jgi:hypothetical protein
LCIDEVVLLGLTDGFFFRLREGGGDIFSKEGDKGPEKPVKALLLGGFCFTQTTSPTPLMDVVSNVGG